MNESTKDTNVDNVSKFFDGYAHDFSSIYLEDTKKRSSFNKIMDNIFRKDIQDRHDRTIGFTDSNKNINTVLDIGCGPGHQVVEFLKQGKQVTALDVAPSMLDITKNRVAAMGAEANFDYVLADVPCSGSGTWRRNPQQKWRITPGSLKENLNKQTSFDGEHHP